MPVTSVRSLVSRKGPFSRRYSMMAAAREGPMPGRASSSQASARLMLIRWGASNWPASGTISLSWSRSAAVVVPPAAASSSSTVSPPVSGYQPGLATAPPTWT